MMDDGDRDGDGVVCDGQATQQRLRRRFFVASTV